MCLAVKGRLQGRTAKLLLARWISWYHGTNLTYNGPAIWGGCVTRRKHRVESWYFSSASRKLIPGYKIGGGYWRSVAVQVVSKPEICQGAGLICVQMRVSGCKNHYKFVLSAGAKAKSVTSNLPILSVLAAGFYLSILFKSKS